MEERGESKERRKAKGEEERYCKRKNGERRGERRGEREIEERQGEANRQEKAIGEYGKSGDTSEKEKGDTREKNAERKKDR